jgi:hypothetical protein
MVAEVLRLLLHLADLLPQRLQPQGHLFLAAITMALVFADGLQQAIQTCLQGLLEARQVGRLLHAGLQAADLLAQLQVETARTFHRLAVALVGFVEGAEKCGQALIELLQVAGELALTAVGNRQHQHGQVVQHGHQLVPVQTATDPLAQGVTLGTMVGR